MMRYDDGDLDCWNWNHRHDYDVII